MASLYSQALCSSSVLYTILSPKFLPIGEKQAVFCVLSCISFSYFCNLVLWCGGARYFPLSVFSLRTARAAVSASDARLGRRTADDARHWRDTRVHVRHWIGERNAFVFRTHVEIKGGNYVVVVVLRLLWSPERSKSFAGRRLCREKFENRRQANAIVQRERLRNYYRTSHQANGLFKRVIAGNASSAASGGAGRF